MDRSQIARMLALTLPIGTILAFPFSHWGWLGIAVAYLLPLCASLIDIYWQNHHPDSYADWAASARPSDEKDVQVKINGHTYSGRVKRDD